ncbi:hypothetical protein CO661_16110 [Sinorhizobium fredii]|uniref:Uncharacterized protein n=1 Tax=Rhizobium fredii TaxID=380 RepID=A0A2A6LX18_RHIFR|nr:hypothetical protein CO661_16110 [Sinorhizobium fredii]
MVRLPRTKVLQRRASYQTRKGRCTTLICCMSLSLNRGRFKETCSPSLWQAAVTLPSGRSAQVASQPVSEAGGKVFW